MDSWDEVKTAYQVARAGTVSGAADVLGVHHATVIRHIDALEARLGVKLFQRHARGYSATEAGTDLLKVAQTTEDQFAQLEGRIKGRGQGVTGELVITTLASISSQIAPIVTAYQIENPEITARFLTGERVFRLEYGEAHVAIRAGSKPEEPDNVVQHLMDLQSTLVASKSYIARRGMPKGLEDLKSHSFVGHDDESNRAPFFKWQQEHIGRDAVRFRTTDDRVTRAAIHAGAGLGFISSLEAAGSDNLVEVMPSLPEWVAPLWLVTHVDLHRTAKVQSFLNFIKDSVKTSGDH